MRELEEGEMICDRCNGTGTLKDNDFNDIFYSPICIKCNGDGKLTWVENIFGKQINDERTWNSIAINSNNSYVSTSDGSVWKQLSSDGKFKDISDGE